MSDSDDMTSGYSYHDRLIIAHAVFASVATLITAPAAILIARFFRHKRWLPAHAVLQLMTLAFVVITFALGTRAVASGGHGSQFEGKGADLHHQLGLAIFLIVMVTGFGGILAHFTKGPSLPSTRPLGSLIANRNPLRFLHVFLGLASAALLYAQLATGFDEWDETSDAMTNTPKGVRVVFWVLLGLEVGAYLVGLVLEVAIGGKRNGQSVERKEEKEGLAAA